MRLLDTYLSLLPPNAPYFYMRVLDKFPTEPNKSVVSKQRVGVNLLKSMLPDISEKSEVGVRYTNHSLRATAITRMFNSGVSEKIIADTSGHKSIKALRCYERKSEHQQQQVTAVINNGTDFETTESDDKTRALLVKQNVEGHSVSKNFSGSFSNCTFNVHA